jgi:hypothetical protein
VGAEDSPGVERALDLRISDTGRQPQSERPFRRSVLLCLNRAQPGDDAGGIPSCRAGDELIGEPLLGDAIQSEFAFSFVE